MVSKFQLQGLSVFNIKQLKVLGGLVFLVFVYLVTIIFCSLKNSLQYSLRNSSLSKNSLEKEHFVRSPFFFFEKLSRALLQIIACIGLLLDV